MNTVLRLELVRERFLAKELDAKTPLCEDALEKLLAREVPVPTFPPLKNHHIFI
jgi:hypothetical protein